LQISETTNDNKKPILALLAAGVLLAGGISFVAPPAAFADHGEDKVHDDEVHDDKEYNIDDDFFRGEPALVDDETKIIGDSSFEGWIGKDWIGKEREYFSEHNDDNQEEKYNFYDKDDYADGRYYIQDHDDDDDDYDAHNTDYNSYINKVKDDLEVKEVEDDLTVKEVKDNVEVKEVEDDLEVKEVEDDVNIKEVEDDVNIKEADDVIFKDVDGNVNVNVKEGKKTKEILKNTEDILDDTKKIINELDDENDELRKLINERANDIEHKIKNLNIDDKALKRISNQLKALRDDQKDTKEEMLDEIDKLQAELADVEKDLTKKIEDTEKDLTAKIEDSEDDIIKQINALWDWLRDLVAAFAKALGLAAAEEADENKK
jgi:DNA repair exonuclease SbcCD ATPase subunit